MTWLSTVIPIRKTSQRRQTLTASTRLSRIIPIATFCFNSMQPLQRFFLPLLVHTLPVHFPSCVAVGQVCRLFKFYRAKLPHAFRVPVDCEERESPGPLFADSACGSRDSALLLPCGSCARCRRTVGCSAVVLAVAGGPVGCSGVPTLEVCDRFSTQ